MTNFRRFSNFKLQKQNCDLQFLKLFLEYVLIFWQPSVFIFKTFCE